MKAFKSIAVLAGVLGALAPALAQAVNVPFTAVLNGAQEVPSVTTNGSGTATGLLTGDPGSYVFSYTVNYSGLTGVIASPFAHIHNAAFGANGPIVHDLDGATLPPIAGSTSGTINGDWRFDDSTRPLTDALATALLGGNMYFNIHTDFSRSGEIRGQLSAVPEPSAVLLLALGAAGLAVVARRRRPASAQ
jgi:hypothetical protein